MVHDMHTRRGRRRLPAMCHNWRRDGGRGPPATVLTTLGQAVKRDIG